MGFFVEFLFNQSITKIMPDKLILKQNLFNQINILADEKYFIAIDKPAGISVHNDHLSLESWLSKNKLSNHFVNRLDEATSGIMLISKSSEMHQPLSEALQLGEKKYWAIVRGTWKSASTEFTWDWPLTDKAEGFKKPEGDKKNQIPCLTIGKVLLTNKYFTKLECTLKTGRQHQIRKHAALARHPILGDNRYNQKNYNEKIFKLYNFQRMLLHSFNLKFEFKSNSFHLTSNQFNYDSLLQ